MRERPIIFSRPMIRAILEARKTMTRRVIRYPLPVDMKSACEDGGGNWIFWSGPVARDMDAFTKHAYPNGEGFTCPYGRPGDRLWVRETWFKHEDDPVVFRADLNGEQLKEEKAVRRRASEAAKEYPWESPIFMPRWASRITLELTDIRVERLQEISVDDIQAEGVGANWWPETNMRAQWQQGWDALNTKRGLSWASNPWVWVLTFRKV